MEGKIEPSLCCMAVVFFVPADIVTLLSDGVAMILQSRDASVRLITQNGTAPLFGSSSFES